MSYQRIMSQHTDNDRHRQHVLGVDNSKFKSDTKIHSSFCDHLGKQMCLLLLGIIILEVGGWDIQYDGTFRRKSPRDIKYGNSDRQSGILDIYSLINPIAYILFNANLHWFDADSVCLSWLFMSARIIAMLLMLGHFALSVFALEIWPYQGLFSMALVLGAFSAISQGDVISEYVRSCLVVAILSMLPRSLQDRIFALGILLIPGIGSIVTQLAFKLCCKSFKHQPKSNFFTIPLPFYFPFLIKAIHSNVNIPRHEIVIKAIASLMGFFLCVAGLNYNILAYSRFLSLPFASTSPDEYGKSFYENLPDKIWLYDQIKYDAKYVALTLWSMLIISYMSVVISSYCSKNNHLNQKKKKRVVNENPKSNSYSNENTSSNDNVEQSRNSIEKYDKNMIIKANNSLLAINNKQNTKATEDCLYKIHDSKKNKKQKISVKSHDRKPKKNRKLKTGNYERERDEESDDNEIKLPNTTNKIIDTPYTLFISQNERSSKKRKKLSSKGLPKNTDPLHDITLSSNSATS